MTEIVSLRNLLLAIVEELAKRGFRYAVPIEIERLHQHSPQELWYRAASVEL